MVNLILDLKRAGHPYFADLQEDSVRHNAAGLPDNGVPPEVLTVLHELDDAHDKLQPQKAATPCDGMLDLAVAGEAFAAQRPRAAVAEGSANQDANMIAATALQELQADLANGPQMKTLEVRTGNKLVDQFQPCYFATAFCFCFQYGTACPDVTNTATATAAEQNQKSRRARIDPQAPEVGIQQWARGMQRRIEAQFRRDWNFGFTVWNYLFRTMVNTQKNAYMFTAPDPHNGGTRPLTNEEIIEGVTEVTRHLWGNYVDINGMEKAVNGDLTKLWHIPRLSTAGKRVLSNMEARTRNIPGTHDVRKTMRHQTHANRICYGTSLFITFSPSERDSALMLRLARTRCDDPALLLDEHSRLQHRDLPRLDEDFIRLDPEMLRRVSRNCDVHSGFLCFLSL